MTQIMKLVGLALASVVLVGCETTNSIPYKASTNNVMAIQQTVQAKGKKIALGDVTLAAGQQEELLCRLMGPVKVAPGKSLTQYIQDAFQEELFLAQSYDPKAPVRIVGTVESISFSSVSPAYWDIAMSVRSNTSAGYRVQVKYPFDTSWTAYAACKNVADAFGPAVQELIKAVVTDARFAELAGAK